MTMLLIGHMKRNCPKNKQTRDPRGRGGRGAGRGSSSSSRNRGRGRGNPYKVNNMVNNIKKEETGECSPPPLTPDHKEGSPTTQKN